MKGIRPASWLLPMRAIAATARAVAHDRGAIYVNRNGFADRGASLETEFKSAALTDQIDDATGDLFCVFLKPSPHPVLPPIFAN